MPRITHVAGVTIVVYRYNQQDLPQMGEQDFIALPLLFGVVGVSFLKPHQPYPLSDLRRPYLCHAAFTPIAF